MNNQTHKQERNSDDDKTDIRLLHHNEETCTIQKGLRGSLTVEDANQMPDEDCSSHRSSVFTQIAEKKRMLSFAKSINAAFLFFFAHKNRAFSNPKFLIISG